MIGTCGCTHDASLHDRIEQAGGAFGGTPCRGTVLGPTSMSGNVIRQLACTCIEYAPITTEVLDALQQAR